MGTFLEINVLHTGISIKGGPNTLFFSIFIIVLTFK
jgi:hypothetical protein